MNTKEYRDRVIKAGSEIEDDLVRIFGKNNPITIADIGACDGLSTVIYSRIFPFAKFYCFEPIHENYREMEENLKHYGVNNVIAFQYALAEANGEDTFYRSHGSAGAKDHDQGNKSSSLLKPKEHLKTHPWCKFKEDKVLVRSLDFLQLPKIDFMHIDVQGAELRVLVGAERALTTTRAIWLEVSNVEMYDGQPLKRDISLYLDRNGFSLVKDECGHKKQGDMLWEKK
jgi:FkbM family methyltransferase